jgi:hypothetical protein
MNYQQNWQQQQYANQTPYPGQRMMEAPPLVHAQSMPVLPSADGGERLLLEERKTPGRRRGVFR